MTLKLGSRALPVMLLIFSSLWAAATFSPFIYSLLFPEQDIRHIVAALEGRETLRQELAPLLQGTVDAFGHLKRAIQVGAYWHATADYNVKKSHTTREIELSYLAWFAERSKPTILIITRTETDRSSVRFDIEEGRPLGIVRAYLLPVLVLAFSAYWFRRSRRLAAATSDAPRVLG